VLAFLFVNKSKREPSFASFSLRLSVESMPKFLRTYRLITMSWVLLMLGFPQRDPQTRRWSHNGKRRLYQRTSLLIHLCPKYSELFVCSPFPKHSPSYSLSRLLYLPLHLLSLKQLPNRPNIEFSNEFFIVMSSILSFTWSVIGCKCLKHLMTLIHQHLKYLIRRSCA